jgi:hypothetical protein
MDRPNISNPTSDRKTYKDLSHSLAMAFVCLAHNYYMCSWQSQPVNKIRSAASQRRSASTQDASQWLASNGPHTVPWPHDIALWENRSIHASPLDEHTRSVNYVPMQGVKILRTVDQVIEEFGSPSAAAEWAGVGASAVCNWSARGYIPPGWHYRMSQHFAEKGVLLAGTVFGERDERPLASSGEVVAA